MKILLVGHQVENEIMAGMLRRSPDAPRVLGWPAGPSGVTDPGFWVPASDASVTEVARFAAASRVDLVILTSNDAVTSGIANVLEIYRIPCLGPNRVSAHFLFDDAFLKGYAADCGIKLATASTHYTQDEAMSAAFERLSECGRVSLTAQTYTGSTVRCSCGTREDVFRAFMQFAATFEARRVEHYRVGRDVPGIHCTYVCMVNGTTILPTGVSFHVASDERYSELLGYARSTSPIAPAAAAYGGRIARDIVAPFVQGFAEEGSPYTGWLVLDVVVGRSAMHLTDARCAPDTDLIRRLSEADGCDWLGMIQFVMGWRESGAVKEAAASSWDARCGA